MRKGRRAELVQASLFLLDHAFHSTFSLRRAIRRCSLRFSGCTCTPRMVLVIFLCRNTLHLSTRGCPATPDEVLRDFHDQ